MRRLLGLVVLLLVLAIGIALGAGPLGDRIDDRTTSASTSATRHGTQGRSSSDPVDAALIAGVAPAALSGKLDGQAVAILALPGSSPGALSAISTDIAAAGGMVASVTKLTESVTAVGSKQLVDSLGSQLTTQLASQMPGVVDPSLTTYPRMGTLLGAALTAKAPSAPASPVAETIRASLKAGDLVAEAPTGNLGTLTLLLTGTNVDDAILTGLVSGLASQSNGIVVSGETDDGDVAVVRDEKPKAGTFDGYETAGGAVSTVLLLARQITAPGGAFGASGSDGPVPVG